MDANKRMFKFMSHDLIKGAGMFWLVMIIVNIASYLIPYLISSNTVIGPMIRAGQSMTYAGSNFFAVFIFFIVYSIEMYYENFTLAIGFGGTRKNFFINLLINTLIIVLLFATIQIILLKIDYHVVSFMGYEPIVEYGFFNISEDNILSNILSLSFIFLVQVSITNFIGVMQYRFSYKFWIGLGIFVLLSQRITNFIGRFFGGIVDYDHFIGILSEGNFISSNQSFFAIGLIIMLVAYSIGYAFIRRANVK
ncbi:MAG: hypothetical protein RIN55_08575 [Tissierellaceae bacterium]|nr:hypothetical protein [Tissierellaceae bacterium]